MLRYGVACFGAAAGVLAAAAFGTVAHADWKPTKTVEFIVPAGTGGGADQMARMIQGIVQKHGLMEQPLVVVNKGGGAGAEGFLEVKNAQGDPHKMIITLSSLFTTPLATGVPFNWKDLTPAAMLALDEFVLWVPADAPYENAKDFLAAVKAANGQMKMGGTGSKQEDQIISVALSKAAGAPLPYVPYKGGGEVATQLVGKHIDLSVNNPIEAVSHWKAGNLKPLCVFDKERMPMVEKVTSDKAWSDIPTCRESGIDFDYLMLRGIFLPPGVDQAAVDYYVGLLQKVRETPEWKEFMANGAFNTTFMTGDEFKEWLGAAEETHKSLMQEGGFLQGS